MFAALSLPVLFIKYECSSGVSEFAEDNIRKLMKSKLDSNYNREIMQGNTLFGPHRDDFSFYIGDDNLRIFSSQGGQRLAVIVLKLSELPIFKKFTGFYPILLLDDIFSEIDSKKRNRLVKYINCDIQTIITATDLKNINKKLLDDAKIFEVFSGDIREREAK